MFIKRRRGRDRARSPLMVLPPPARLARPASDPDDPAGRPRRDRRPPRRRLGARRPRRPQCRAAVHAHRLGREARRLVDRGDRERDGADLRRRCSRSSSGRASGSRGLRLVGISSASSGSACSPGSIRRAAGGPRSERSRSWPRRSRTRGANLFTQDHYTTTKPLVLVTGSSSRRLPDPVAVRALSAPGADAERRGVRLGRRARHRRHGVRAPPLLPDAQALRRLAHRARHVPSRRSPSSTA